MNNAQPRVIGLVAIASWLLLDSLRMAGPLLSGLDDSPMAVTGAVVFATFAGGGLLAWLAAMVGRHFGHGVVVLYLLAVLAVLRLGLPMVSGGWLIAAGLYLTAFAIAGVVMATRVALGNGGAGYVLAGTALGAAAAVAEQTVLRTWDAVWREDALGWGAMALVAVLAIVNGVRCRRLEPAPSSRGWWAFGLYWALLGLALANVAWVNAHTDLRMSFGSALTIVSLCLGAGLAAQVHRVSRATSIVIGVAGVIALGVLVQRQGTDVAFALPVVTAALTLAAAQSVHPRPSKALRRLMAALGFGLAIIVPPLLVQVDSELPLGFPHLAVMLAAGIAVIAYGTAQAWSEGKRDSAERGSWIAPGVLVRVSVGVVVAIGVGYWTHATYEQEQLYSADFVAAPYVMSWNVHQGITHEAGNGPRLDLDEVAATVRGNDVIALQEVSRGALLSGGTDMLEYLAGELELPYSYAAAHDRQYGNAIFTSRPHANPRGVELAQEDAAPRRSALAVDFMGATFASAQLQPTDDADRSRLIQAQEVADWVAGPHATVVAGDFGREPGSPAHTVMIEAGFVDAQMELDVTGVTYVGPGMDAEQAGTVDYIFGRNAEFTQFQLLDVPWSDHRPLTARVSTGAQPPTDGAADNNEVQSRD